MAQQPIRVIKLGGSLLDWPELGVRLRRWLAQQPAATNVLIVGGGPIVEGLRAIDRVHRLPVKSSHWLAIRAMSLSAQVAAELLPESRFVDSLEAIDRARGVPLLILDTESTLRAEEGTGESLPHGWDVTSDSIAARVAVKLGAEELVLLKSTLPGQDASGKVNSKGYVDAHFDVAARGLTVRCVNLRDAGFSEMRMPID